MLEPTGMSRNDVRRYEVDTFVEGQILVWDVTINVNTSADTYVPVPVKPDKRSDNS